MGEWPTFYSLPHPFAPFSPPPSLPSIVHSVMTSLPSFLLFISFSCSSPYLIITSLFIVISILSNPSTIYRIQVDIVKPSNYLHPSFVLYMGTFHKQPSLSLLLASSAFTLQVEPLLSAFTGNEIEIALMKTLRYFARNTFHGERE